MPTFSSAGLGFTKTAWSPMSVPEPMPSIQKVAGVPPGVVESGGQHDGFAIRCVSESNVKLNAAESYASPPTEPLPMPEKVMTRGSALASAVSSNPVNNSLRFIRGFSWEVVPFSRPVVLPGADSKCTVCSLLTQIKQGAKFRSPHHGFYGRIDHLSRLAARPLVLWDTHSKRHIAKHESDLRHVANQLRELCVCVAASL